MVLDHSRLPPIGHWASLCHNARGHQKPQWIDDIRGQYTTSCYDAQVAPGPIHPPEHDDVRSDLSSSCYDVQVSPGHFNSLRQQWWPFHGGPIWWPAADAVYPISSWSASATNCQSSQNQRPSLASIHVANCSCPMSAGHTNAHPRRRLGGWQRFSRKINKRK